MTFPPPSPSAPDPPHAAAASARPPIPLHDPSPPRRLAILVVGTLAASAATGSMLGFGIRVGVPSRAFNVVASVVSSDLARGVWGWDIRVTLLGITLVVLAMFGWGAVFALLAVTLRGWRVALAAVAVSAVAWLVDGAALSGRISADAARVFGPGQLLGLHLVLAATLAAGMRFAFPGVGATDVGRAPLPPAP